MWFGIAALVLYALVVVASVSGVVDRLRPGPVRDRWHLIIGAMVGAACVLVVVGAVYAPPRPYGP